MPCFWASRRMVPALTVGQTVLPHGGGSLRREAVDNGDPGLHICFRQGNVLSIGHGYHFPHGAQHGVPGFSGNLEAAIAALKDHSGLIETGVAKQLAPQLDADISGLSGGGDVPPLVREVRPEPVRQSALRPPGCLLFGRTFSEPRTRPPGPGRRHPPAWVRWRCR